VFYILHIRHVGVDASLLLHEVLECHNASNTIARLTLVDTAHVYDYFFFLVILDMTWTLGLVITRHFRDSYYVQINLLFKL